MAARKVIVGDSISMLDPRPEGEANLEEVSGRYKTSCWCIQDDDNYRKSMGQVDQILEGVLQVDIPPIPDALQKLTDKPGNTEFLWSNLRTLVVSHKVSSKMS